MTHRIVTLGAVLATLAALLVAPPAAAGQCPTVPAWAHRGGTEKYVENTRGAFRYATSVGVNRWELDVQFDSAGVPFVIHDPTLDRTTNGVGAVASQDLSAARAHGLRTDDGQVVPSLYEVLTDAAARGARVMVELKTQPTAGQLAAVVHRIDWTGMRGRVIVTSFLPDALTAVRAAAPDVQTGLVDELGDRPAPDVAKYGRHYLKHQWAVTAARLARWSGPVHVYAWTVDQPVDWARMNSYADRLDGVITNRPAAYLAWARARTC